MVSEKTKAIISFALCADLQILSSIAILLGGLGSWPQADVPISLDLA